jgi:Ca2+-binding EF-hand superfamily protein
VLLNTSAGIVADLDVLRSEQSNMPWPGWRFLTALAFALWDLPGPSHAFAQGHLAPSAQMSGQQPKQALFDFDVFLAQTLAPGLRYYAFQQNMKLPFDMHDTDRDGAITDADRQRNRQHFEAMQRAQQISLMLQADLNSDGIIAADELAIFARYQSHLMRGEGPESDVRRAEQVRRTVEARMRADTNGDGKIDWEEIFADARKFPMPSQIDFDAPYRGLLSFDADGDGKTTFREYTDAMERRFAAFDTDGDGLISRAEFDAYWQQSGLLAPKVAEIPPSYEEKIAVECAVPKPAQDIKFVLFNGYRPVALSTAAIGSQDKETRTTKVIIEPGPEPLYLVMIAWDRVIWQFEGAVERVKRVILAEAGVNEREGPPVGATGLAKEVVTVANSDRCGLFWVNMNKRNLKATQERTRLLLGREADVMVSSQDMWNLQLPSGTVSVPSEADQSKTFPNLDPNWGGVRGSLLNFYQGGVMRIDAATVIGGQAVTNYEVLPEQAGLLQLLIEGALVRNERGDFVVTRQTRFPAGLAGAHAVRFIVPNGVPRPTGYPGHSKVTME